MANKILRIPYLDDASNTSECLQGNVSTKSKLSKIPKESKLKIYIAT